MLDAAEPAEAAGPRGLASAATSASSSRSPTTEVSEAIGLIAAAIVILLFAFGTATAMVLPISIGDLGLACALSIIRLLENVVQVPSVASTLATMIGLGVGIDYALFIVTRHKLQLAEGMEVRESVARATATAGGAVVFAGFTVVIALCSLAFAGIPLVSTLGFTAGDRGRRRGAAAATLLPAMLGALGPRINSLRSARQDRTPTTASRTAGRAGPAVSPAGPGARRSPRSPVLAVLAIPIFELELGQNDISALPKSTTARQAYDGLTRGFGPGVNGPLLIAAEFRSPAEATRELPGLEKQVLATPDVAEVSEPTLDAKGTAAVFTVISKSTPWANETVEPGRTPARDGHPPGAGASAGAAYVGGQTAGYIDLASQITDKLPLMIAIVVGLSFIVLLLAFRSLLVPVKAAAMNLLSVAAAYGVVTAVFQLGWGSSLIGLDHSIPIVSFVPLLMFAILFGLSMDYEVFLHDPDAGALQSARQSRAGRRRRPRQHRPGDHLGGGDHGLRLHQLRPQRQPGGEGVRGRARRGDRDRLDPRPLPAGARGDGAAGRPRLVAARAAGPDPAPHQHRGGAVLRAARRSPQPPHPAPPSADPEG